LGLGFLSQPGGPNWVRWLGTAILQCVIGAAAGRFVGRPWDALRPLALKTALWPAIAAGLAGAARLVGIDLYHHLHTVALIALAASHLLGARLTRTTGLTGFGGWLLDLRWSLAIAGVPWSWNLASNLRLTEFLAGSALFLFFVPPRQWGERAAHHRCDGPTDLIRARVRSAGLPKIGTLVAAARGTSARYRTRVEGLNDHRRTFSRSAGHRAATVREPEGTGAIGATTSAPRMRRTSQ
jgi:hypothetical protein